MVKIMGWIWLKVVDKIFLEAIDKEPTNIFMARKASWNYLVLNKIHP